VLIAFAVADLGYRWPGTISVNNTELLSFGKCLDFSL